MRNPDRSYHLQFSDEADWVFKSLSDPEEIRCALLWEYGRQSQFLGEVDQNWDTPLIQNLSIYQRDRLSAFRRSQGFPFPATPWQRVDEPVKSKVKDILLRMAYVHGSLASVAEEIRHVQELSSEKQRKFLFIEITPDAWETNYDEDINAFIAAEIRRCRPGGFYQASRRGRSFLGMKTALTWLGAMRIKALYDPAEARRLARKHFPDRTLAVPDAWSRIKAKAKDRMAQLFPFLPAAEVERSFPTWGEFQGG